MRRFILCLVLAMIALPVLAGEHDASFYKRTATKPPGDWYLGFRAVGANHMSGVGLATAGVWKNVGKYNTDIIWSGDISALQVAGQVGSVPITIRCIDYMVPFVAPDRTVGLVGTNVLFRVK